MCEEQAGPISNWTREEVQHFGRGLAALPPERIMKIPTDLLQLSDYSIFAEHLDEFQVPSSSLSCSITRNDFFK